MLLAVMLVPAVSQALSVSGSYSSTEGAVTLQQSGDRVSGSYTNDNGELTGLMFGNVFEGFWIEDNSAKRCTTPKNGRYHWGRVTLEFNSKGFSGTYGHCNDVSVNPWNGSRTSGGQGFIPPVDSGNDPFAVITDSPNIEGLWSSSEGEIKLRQQGNRVAGRYPNDNGEIVGTLNNGTLSGFWIEDNSAQRCTTSKNGRYNWGRVELSFSGNRFTGRYGHCEGPLTSNWSGERK